MVPVPIYNLMRFPRELSHEFTPDYIISLPISCISHASIISQVIDANFLNKLAAVSTVAGFYKVVSRQYFIPTLNSLFDIYVLIVIMFALSIF